MAPLGFKQLKNLLVCRRQQLLIASRVVVAALLHIVAANRPVRLLELHFARQGSRRRHIPIDHGATRDSKRLLRSA